MANVYNVTQTSTVNKLEDRKSLHVLPRSAPVAFTIYLLKFAYIKVFTATIKLRVTFELSQKTHKSIRQKQVFIP